MSRSRTVRVFREALVGAVALALGGMVVYLIASRGGGTSPVGVDGWALDSGRFARSGRANGGLREVLVVETAVLRSAGAELTADASSRLRFDPPPPASPPRAPAVLEGTAWIDLSLPTVVAGYLLSPETEARLRVTPGRIDVLSGTVRARDRVLRAGDTLHGGVGHAAGDAPPSGPPPRRVRDTIGLRGTVVDAATLSPLGGVEVRAAYSLGDSGYPPAEEEGGRVTVLTAGDGSFEVPAFRPDDPRYVVHLEATPLGYVPFVHVVEAAPGAGGRRPDTTLRLRRGSTRDVVFFDPAGAPLRGGAVEILSRPRDGFLGEDLWEEGRTVRRDRPLIRYTSKDGRLRLERRPATLALRHPLLYVFDYELERGVERLVLTEELVRDERYLEPGDLDVHTAWGAARRYLLEDASGRPVRDAPVEIALDGMRPVELRTDAEGEFEFAARPAPGEERRPEVLTPRRGTLTILSPLLWKQRISVELPSTATRLVAPGRLGALVHVRFVEDHGDAQRPVAVELLRSASELTVVHRGTDGRVLLAGGLPAPASTLDFVVSGYLPVSVRVPTNLPGTDEVDLGTVTLERGESVDVRLGAVDSDRISRVELRVSDVDAPWIAHYPSVGVDGRARVTGLVALRRYLFALGGTRIEPVRYQAVLTKELLEDGLELPLRPSPEIDTVVHGRVVGVLAERSHLWRVIERYYPEDGSDPSTCVPYPLPADGFIGSRRVLPPSRRVEVFVVGPQLRAARVARDRRGLWYEFDLRDFAPRDGYHAICSFRAEGLGWVPPPRDISLIADQNRYHEVARLERVGPYLVASNLVPGRYVLRWGEDGSPTEATTIEVEEGVTRLKAEIPLEARIGGVAILRLEDPDGEPVEGARVRVRGLPPAGTPPAAGEGPPPSRTAESSAGRRARSPRSRRGLVESLGLREREGSDLPLGHYEVEVEAETRGVLEVLAPDFLPVYLERLSGAELPGAIRLERAAAAEALVLDTDRLPFDGELDVSVLRLGGRRGEELPDGVREVSGPPQRVVVREGRFAASWVPPGEVVVTFRRASGEARAELRCDVRPDRRNDLGTIQLTETRELRGTVLSADGTPAARALVALVPPEKSFRFPQRSDGVEEAEYIARTDGVGRFRLDGLPLDLDADLALLARRDGFTDAIEYPVDLARDERVLVLAYGSTLVLDAGVADPRLTRFYDLRLYYAPGEAPGSFRDLGELGSTPRGGTHYRGLTPGTYRAIWSLRDGDLEGVPKSWSEAVVAPGTWSVLSARVNDVLLEGSAHFNKAPLERGWIVLTCDPEDPRALRTGRVHDGQYQISVARGADVAYVALVPEGDDARRPEFHRGEGLPQRVASFGAVLRSGRLDVEYEAYDLTIEVLPALLERHGPIEVEFPHYRLRRRGFEEVARGEILGEPELHLRLLPPGPITLRLTGTGGLSSVHSLDLREDTKLVIRR